VTYTYNPSYSGGRDQEALGLRPTQGNSFQDPIWKKTHHKKKGWWSDSRCRPGVQAPVPQKKRKKKMNLHLLICNALK
jgi:hypothetical protein